MTESEGTSGLIDLSFYNTDGEYMDALATEGKVMVVSVYDTDINEHKWEEIGTFIRNAEETGFRTLLLVSEIPAADIGVPMYSCDFKTLIATNRSNGGATYFSDGYLLRKWARRDLPDLEKLMITYEEDETEAVIYHKTKGSLGFQGFLLYVFAVMLLL
jgi:hypothetical protein